MVPAVEQDAMKHFYRYVDQTSRGSTLLQKWCNFSGFRIILCFRISASHVIASTMKRPRRVAREVGLGRGGVIAGAGVFPVLLLCVDGGIDCWGAFVRRSGA
jgi:hypothetical protein